MSAELCHKSRALLTELGLRSLNEPIKVEPLTGGVASDIVMIILGNQKICAKFALSQLRVAEEWHAPVHRNSAEYAWLQVAADIAPESSVRLFGHSEAMNGFAMEFVEGEDVVLWKSELLAGRGVSRQAAMVGDLLGRIHSATATPDFDSARFQNSDDFRALRIEPYLTFTATRWPKVSTYLNKLAEALYSSRQTLIHGDVSPKNILFRDGNAILLDAECATMGDASFDIAFCLNHLILKALHLSESRTILLNMVAELWDAYAHHIDWEAAGDLEGRVCRLAPALMLARIDGKSPVEYLEDVERADVRTLAFSLIEQPPTTLQDLTEHLSARMIGTTE